MNPLVWTALLAFNCCTLMYQIIYGSWAFMGIALCGVIISVYGLVRSP